MTPRFRRPKALISAAVLLLTMMFFLAPQSAEAGKSINYTFRFVNGTTISGVASKNTVFLADAGGTSAENPTGMTVHVSCSDDFPDGWGEKDGPEEGVDTAWQIESFFIQKGDKTCGVPTPPEPPAPPPAIDIEKAVNGEDADTPTGPTIELGGDVTFSYVVTNTGGVPLTDVAVVDSELGAIGCPSDELEPEESMSCDEQTETTTTAGQFTMKATVTGLGLAAAEIPPLPPRDDKKDIAYRFTFVNGMSITGVSTDKTEFVAEAGGTSVDNPTGMTMHLSCSDKFTGGWGQKDGPEQGVDTAWQIASYSISKGSKTCGGTFAEPEPSDPVEVMDMDPVHFVVLPAPTPPSIDVEKFVNGEDADTAPGPELPIGSTATFTYVVTNDGEIPLVGISLSDNVAGPLTCPTRSLDVGEDMACTATTMVVEAGQQFMEACVVGVGVGGAGEVDDCDPVHYTGVPTTPPSIDVEKYVNGEDADNPPGPELPIGSTATFTYRVTNDGPVPLEDVVLVDNVAGVISCPQTSLAVGEGMDCSVTTMEVEAGQQFMKATVSGVNGATVVTDMDPVHYKGVPDRCTVTIDFINYTGEVVKVIWVAADGTERIFGTPGAGETFTAYTFVDQDWIVRDRGGYLIAEFTPDDCGHYTIEVSDT